MNEDVEMVMSYEQARETKEALEKLLTSDGWKFYLEFLSQRANGFSNVLAAAEVRTMEDVAAFNKTQGALREVASTEQMMEQVLSNLKSQVYRMQDEMEATNEEDTTDVR